MDENEKITASEIREIDKTEETSSPPEAVADASTEAETEVAREEACPSEEAPAPEQGKSKRKLPPFIQKIADFLKTHEDIRQMVMFFLFSLICGGTQFLITLVLPLLLNLIPSLKPSFAWFLFEYPTTGEFIGFLVGSVIGQILTFALNRKKTFNMPNYLVMRAIMYAILAILIILMQTYLGGVVTSACQKAVPDANELLSSVFNITGQAVAGIAALIVNFLGNKFFVMRDWGGKIKKANEEKARAEAQLAADADNPSPTAENTEREALAENTTDARSTVEFQPAAPETADLEAQAAADIDGDN